MSITRPVGEQLTFKSAKTGDHILDTYLEAVERGTRTLADIVDELVDSSGNLRTDIFQFRETPAVNGVSSGILQARVGTFVDANAGWTNISSSNFAALVTACQAAQAAAETAETNVTTDLALTNADVVLTHADVVLTNADVVLAEADKVQTGLDRAAVAADLLLTNADVVLAEADKVQTGLDRVATNADVVLTNADVVLTHADVVLAEADKVQTGLDRIATAADKVATNQDVVLTNQDVVLAEADKVQTGLDRVATGADVTTTNTKASEASTSATNAANSAAAAASAFDSFDDKYLGAKATEPTVDNDGDALVTGNLYFLTGTGMQVYDGANWIAASSSGNVSLYAYEYIATAGQTSFSGADSNNQTLSYAAGNLHVTYGGLDIPTADYTATNGTTVVLDDGALVDTIVRIVAFQSFVVADTYTQSQANVLLAAKATVANFTSTGIDDNATSTAITIDASENVGIGTASPSEKLHIGASGNDDKNSIRIDGSSGSGQTWGTIIESDGENSRVSFKTGGSNSTPTQKLMIHPDGGICFGTDTAAANALDDYEEGEWRPTALAGGTAITLGNQSTVQGNYIKTGRLVTVNAEILVTNLNSASGVFLIGGLPFISRDWLNPTGVEASGSISYYASFVSAVNSLTPYVAGGTNQIGIVGITSATAASATDLSAGNIGGSATFRLSVSYVAA